MNTICADCGAAIGHITPTTNTSKENVLIMALFQALDEQDHGFDLRVREDPGIAGHADVAALVSRDDLRRRRENRLPQVRFVGDDRRGTVGKAPRLAEETLPPRP